MITPVAISTKMTANVGEKQNSHGPNGLQKASYEVEVIRQLDKAHRTTPQVNIISPVCHVLTPTLLSLRALQSRIHQKNLHILEG